jgi:hypothetical protein
VDLQKWVKGVHHLSSCRHLHLRLQRKDHEGKVVMAVLADRVIA